MRREEILKLLSGARTELREKFFVRWLAIFGSVARGEDREGSDIDVLVEFDREPGFDGYLALKWRLEDLLGARVDLVMNDALRPGARERVEAEALRVA